MQDIRQEQASSTIYFAVGKVSSKDLEVEDDELSKSSWLMQLFTDVDEANLATNQNRQYRLEFTEQENRIFIEVKDAKNSSATDEDGDTYSTALAEQLRNILADKLD